MNNDWCAKDKISFYFLLEIHSFLGEVIGSLFFSHRCTHCSLSSRPLAFVSPIRMNPHKSHRPCKELSHPNQASTCKTRTLTITFSQGCSSPCSIVLPALVSSRCHIITKATLSISANISSICLDCRTLDSIFSWLLGNDFEPECPIDSSDERDRFRAGGHCDDLLTYNRNGSPNGRYTILSWWISQRQSK